MSTKSDLAALADATGNGKPSHNLPAVHGDVMPTPDGVQALAMMSDEAFESRLADLKKGRERIARVQREYMRPDEDFGLIPNTPKPTLFKSGAEKLAQLYGLAARVESAFVQGDGEKSPPLTFNAEAYLHIGSFDGPIVAVGHGTANSWEKRYRRDQKVCPNCSQPKIIRSKWPENIAADKRDWFCLNCKSKYGAADPQITEQSPQIGGDIRDAYDLGVTLLKMSEKRAFVDAVLRATATSGLFTQDMAEEAADDETPVSTGFGPPVAQRASQEPSVHITRDGVAAPQVATPMPDDPFRQQFPDGTIVNVATGATEQYGEEPLVVQKQEWPDTGREPLAEMTEEQFAAVTKAVGGEVVELSPSNVENVGRGGRTEGANSAQINEVRRLAGQLSLGSKSLLDMVDTWLGLGLKAPDGGDISAMDGRNARSMLSALLDEMSSENIGRVIQNLHAEVENAAPVVTP